ncbi:MAG: DUF3618 domain-containing protein [Rhodospirillales bacterium]|nr:DUF3618 domain-containing protein [Rhodospirillales bacterium]
MNTYKDKSPDEIEQEIIATREHIDRTLDVLTERLSPGGLFDQAMHTARETGGEFTLNLGRTVRDNPVPVALLGLGLGWLMVADRQRKSGYGGYASYDYNGRGIGGYAASDGGDESYRRRVAGTPTPSAETRDIDVPDDWAAAYEAQPREWAGDDRAGVTGHEHGTAGDSARRAYETTRAEAEAMRSSLVESGRRGSERAREAADRARDAVGDTADRLRAGGRDAGERVRAGAHDSADRLRASGHDAAERVRAGGRDASERLRAGGRDAAERMRHTGRRVKERMRDGRRGLAESADDAMAHTRAYGEAVSERASAMYRRSGYAVRSAGERAVDAAGSAGAFAREHPLAVGLVVAAAGAIIAGLAPRSRREDELMGETSDELKSAARDAANAEIERVRDAASAAMRTGREEARRAGLTADDALAAADEKVAAGIGVAKSAAQTGIDKMEERHQGKPSTDPAAMPAETVIGSEHADKIQPQPTADKPSSEAEPGKVGGVSGIETPPVAGGSFGSTGDSHPIDPTKPGDWEGGEPGHERT